MSTIGTTRITVRYFAAAKAAVGSGEETLDAPSPATLAQVTDLMAQRHGERLAGVLRHSSFLLDGVGAERSTAIPDGATLDVLPPFAGG